MPLAINMMMIDAGIVGQYSVRAWPRCHVIHRDSLGFIVFSPWFWLVG